MPTPRLVKYWGGLFRLCTENLPDSVKGDKELQNKVLQMLAAKYANFDWGNTLPADRLNQMNNYVYSLLEEYF